MNTRTPIKVRGKGARKAGFKPPSCKRRKLTNDDGDDTKTKSKGKNVLDKRAPIERLPGEILQLILLYSGEYNFPKCSLRIGRELSHPSFLAEVVQQAFEPTWDMYYGVIRSRFQSYVGWFNDRDRFPGDPVRQTKVLALPFINLSIIHRAMARWATTQRKPRHYQHMSDTWARDYASRKELKLDREDGADLILTRTDHRVRHTHRVDPRQCFHEEWFVHWFMPKSHDRYAIIFEYDEPLGHGIGARLEIHPDTKIPDRLITGPFSWMDVKLLWWLVHNNAVFDHDTQSYDMVKKGISWLFDNDNLYMAHIVMYLWSIIGAYKNWPADEHPISIERAYAKIKAHEDDSNDDDGPKPMHLRGWKGIVDWLFEATDNEVPWAVAWMVPYQTGLYRQTPSPWVRTKWWH